MIRAFIRYYFRRNVRNWRALRKVCMAQLPKIDRKLEGAATIDDYVLSLSPERQQKVAAARQVMREAK